MNVEALHGLPQLIYIFLTIGIVLGFAFYFLFRRLAKKTKNRTPLYYLLRLVAVLSMFIALIGILMLVIWIDA